MENTPILKLIEPTRAERARAVAQRRMIPESGVIAVGDDAGKSLARLEEERYRRDFDRRAAIASAHYAEVQKAKESQSAWEAEQKAAAESIEEVS